MKLLISIILFSISTLVYADNIFHSPYFDISLNKGLKLVSKTEEPNNGFNRYVFASSNNDAPQLEMRIIVSSRIPEKNESLDAFQEKSVSAMSVMFMDSYHLYQYLSTPENKKELNKKFSDSKLKLGSSTYTIVTLHFGDMDASFLVTNQGHMTYAFTLISRDANTKIRTDNLNMLTKQLGSINFKSG